MTQFVYYRSAPGATAWSVDLGSTAIRLGEEEGFVERAEHCQVGMSNVVLDDEAGTLGHSSDAIIGHQRFEVDETDMASGNRSVFRGFTTARGYGRLADPKAPQLGVARQIECELADLNAIPSFRVIPQSDTAAKRPAETVAARLAWILGSTYLSGLVADNGLVASAAAFGCDATDYRGQRPVNVINDCELAADWFAFVYPDETKTVVPSLFFANANTSTAYSSTLRISNVLSDLDTTTAATFTTGTTFAPSRDARLHREPTELGSGVSLPYATGSVYRTRAATAAIYGYRDLVAPNANVKTAAKATDIADKYLWTHHTEDDRITLTVELPTNKVNSIRAGHRIQVKFSHLPGYESFTWCRVLMRSVGQRDKTDDRYSVQLELSPQEAGPAVGGIVQSNFAFWGTGGSGFAPFSHFANPPTIGNTLLVLISQRSGAPGTGAVNAPNIASGLERWGAGAWTELGTHPTYVENTAGDGTKHGIAAFWKTVDSTSQDCQILNDYQNVAAYELTGVNMASATAIRADNQTAASTFDVGTLGTIAAGELAFMIEHSSPDETTHTTMTPASGWVEDWNRGSYPIWYAADTFPVVWVGHAIGAGAVVDPALVHGGAGRRWCGIAIKVTP